jgi:serine/threonine protein kinase
LAIKCPKCHSENPKTATFCVDCGTRLASYEDISVSVTKTLISPVPEGSSVAGRYRILEKLGEGGMGVVYKAEDTRLKRTVALKFMPPELARDSEAKERFVREAQAAAALSHPNICTIHEIDEEKGRSFITMEYIQGQSLQELIKTGPQSINKVLDIAVQVAEGLDEAHKKGVVHRDIKSANIMVTSNGQAKIMDFGLAKVSSGSMITYTTKIMGTIAYMSPEQTAGEIVDSRTDIWSFGVVL